MKIDDTLISYLEELSRLRLQEGERETAKKDLAGILDYIGMLSELDTQSAEALSHPLSITNRFREDEALPSFDRTPLLAGSPRQKDGCFQAPRTVEG